MDTVNKMVSEMLDSMYPEPTEIEIEIDQETHYAKELFSSLEQSDIKYPAKVDMDRAVTAAQMHPNKESLEKLKAQTEKFYAWFYGRWG